MAVVTVRQAKTQLSKLIARTEAGEEIIIARGHEPAVKSYRLRLITSLVAGAATNGRGCYHGLCPTGA
jgi:hypothetical protein